MDKRESGYYSTPPFVAEFIAAETCAHSPSSLSVFDPCVGAGELVLPFLQRGLNVEGIDISAYGVPDGIEFSQIDFLKYFAERSAPLLMQASHYHHDILVANPPYNCHEVEYIRRNKNLLQSAFPEIGIHNMYSMFIAALIDLAKPNALLAFITSDSFLTSRAHTPLREKILSECSLHHLILCPTDLFQAEGADVRTCIIILQKGTHNQRKVKTCARSLSRIEFECVLQKRHFVERDLRAILLGGKVDANEFLANISDDLMGFFASPRISDTFRCLTGISTGDDARFLSSVKADAFPIPFFKNPASRRFFALPNGFLVHNFLEIAKTNKTFMVRNRDYLYREGITCSSMGVTFGACHLPPGATYGVNANIFTDPQDQWWLLAYLNSHLVTYFVRGVLNRSNMVTSGYVARVPVPKLSISTRTALGEIARTATAAKVGIKEAQGYVTDINTLLAQELGLSNESQLFLRTFADNVVRAA